MQGKLFVLEGIDGSGKTTQVRLLTERLEREGKHVRMLDFPRYGRPACAAVEQYLRGDFGKAPGDVNPYVASSFFAVDRAASWLEEDWRQTYENGGLLIANRYTTSNVIHQGSKLPPEEREAYFRWLYDYEFGLLGLPKPNKVLYLKISPERAALQRHGREAAGVTKADIHERDDGYLKACCDCGRLAVEVLGWTSVECEVNGVMRTPEELAEEIYEIVTAS